MKKTQKVKKKGGNKPLVFPDPHKEKMVNCMKAGDMEGLDEENKKEPISVAVLIQYYQMMLCYQKYLNGVKNPNTAASDLKLKPRTVGRWYLLFDTLPKP